MIDALYSLLTNIDARTQQAVEAQLIEQTSAGVPWFDEA